MTLDFYEMEEFEGGSMAPLTILGEGGKSQTVNEPMITKDNRSVPFSGNISSKSVSPRGSTLLNETTDPKPYRSKCGVVPYCCFKIDGKSFMCISINDNEINSYKNAFSSPASRECTTIMYDEISFIENN